MTTARPSQPGSWYRIKNLASQGADIHIYDEIGHFGVSAQDFISDLATYNGPISLHLNTPGGEIFDGIAIFNALKARGDVSVSVEGLAASIGSVIAQAASPGRLSIAENATMMIHDGFSQITGNAAEMRDLATLLDKQSDNIASIYARRTGKSAEFWRNAMKEETWYTGQEAVDAGLADQVSGSQSVQGNWNLSGFRHVPETVLAQMQPKALCTCGASTGQKGTDSNMKNARQSMPEAMPDEDDDYNGWRKRNGKWVFDPIDDGDDDYQAETDVDHDYWSEDGTQLKPIPAGPPGSGKPAKPMPDVKKARKKAKAKAKKAAKALKHAGIFDSEVDHSAWDASKAWHNGASSEDPAAFYKAICAGRKAGDPALQSSWALPYKYTPKSPPNAAAVRNALARIGQTQGLTNKPEAQALLERLMKQINPDYETSSDSIDPKILQAMFLTALEGVN